MNRPWSTGPSTPRLWDVGHLHGTARALADMKCVRPLFVLGTASAGKLVLRDVLDARWSAHERRVVSGIPSGSPIAAVLQLRTAIRAFAPDVVVAIGGGSVIDTAKAACVLAEAHAPDLSEADVIALWTAYPARLPARVIRLVAIPTTAGTGTEATPLHAVLSDAGNTKWFGVSAEFQPDAAVLVPDFVKTVPRAVIGDLAMDAISHAIEALWSAQASPASDLHATTALLLLDAHLSNYYANPADANASRASLLAATHAGEAFRLASSTACHALSFPIAGMLRSSHGSACSMLLALIAEKNVADPATRVKFDGLARALGRRSADDIPAYIQEWRRTLGLDVRLETAIALAADWATPALTDMMANNPVALERTDVQDLLDRISVVSLQ